MLGRISRPPILVASPRLVDATAGALSRPMLGWVRWVLILGCCRGGCLVVYAARVVRWVAWLCCVMVALPVGAQDGDAGPGVGARDAGVGVVTPPRIVRFVEAAYPPEAEAVGEEAAVELELTIGIDGRVSDALVVKSAGEAFDTAALEAVRAFVFEPARRDSVPVAARIRYRYVFELKKPAAPVGGRLVGRVLASGDRPAVGATVTIELEGEEPRETLTDEDGRFYFDELAPGLYRVDVVSPEFGSRSGSEEVGLGEVTELVYRLAIAPRSSRAQFGATAVIDAPPREAVRRTIDKDEFLSIPGTRGDALRTVEILPGVARPPFGVGFLVVRGSAPTDSEVFLEGVSVPLLYHFGGLTSFMNSRLLERIDFYPGNFSARFGRRIGGILEVEARDPQNDKFHGVAEFSFIDTSILGEGPIGDKASIAVGLRRSLIDFIFPALAPDSVGVVAAPVYNDYQLLLTYRPTPKDRVRLLVYGSSDRFKLFFDDALGEDPAARGNAAFVARFHYHQVSWQRKISDRVEQDIDIMAGPIKLNVGLGDSFSFKGDFNQVYGRSEWRLQLSDRVRWIVGSDVFLIPGNLRFSGPRPRQFEGGGGQQEPLAGQEIVELDENTFVARPGIYLETDIALHKRLQMILGLRADYFSAIERFSFDPRLIFLFAARPDLKLKAAAGLFSQPPEFQESDKTIGNPNLKPIRAAHFGLGAEYEVSEGIDVGVEGFYKQLWDRVVNTENGVDPFYVNEGIGRIYGVELSGHFKPPDKRFFAYVSYTLSRSERRDLPGDSWRLFDFDQTHILTTSFVYRFKRNWELGGTFRLVSGNPFTPVAGSVYDSLNDVYSPINGPINSLRNPLFHRLDIRVEKQWLFSAWKLALFFDLQNVYNRQNREGILYNFDFSESTSLNGLPLIPSIGLRGEI